MRLSTQGRFAVTAMIDLALRERQGPVTLTLLSGRLQISTSYLEQLFSKLRQQGLVESTRGPGGGYSLGRAAQTINVAEIISAVDGAAGASAKRFSKGAGEGDRYGVTQELWASLDTKIREHLQSITLRHLADAQLAKGVRIEECPVIKRGIFAPRKALPRKVVGPNSVFALAGALAPRL